MTAAISDVPERWPVVSSQEHFRGKIIGVRSDKVRTPDGSIAEREVVTHPGAVGVVALDESNRVLMIRQYRHPVGRLLWELPAGLRDVRGESLLRNAQRELLEETGYRAGRWNVLTDHYSSPGIITERLRIFLARDPELVPESERNFVPEAEEAHLLVDWVPLEVTVPLILAGELHNGVAVIGLLAAHAASADGFAGLRGAEEPEK
jgi:ADP-ribose pyrophosphatase